jgi:hypothetical protein
LKSAHLTKGAFKSYISAEGGEGGVNSIAYVAYAYRGKGGGGYLFIRFEANSTKNLKTIKEEK